MKEASSPYAQHQVTVNTYFTDRSSFWKDIYASEGVYACIHQERHATALAWIDALMLEQGARVLEIGCGAGFMSIELAHRDFVVQAIDSSEGMIQQARHNAEEAGITEKLSLDVADVYALPTENEAVDMVVALGVIPWLAQPELAMREMARVVKPGGYVLLTADNRARLNIHLDPLLYPGFLPLKRHVKNVLNRMGMRRRSTESVDSYFHTCRQIDTILSRVNLMKTRSKTLGFGPFTFCRIPLLPRSFGTALHHRLQRLADRGVPLLRSSGSQYIVLARKTPVLAPASPIEARTLTQDAPEALPLENARIQS